MNIVLRGAASTLVASLPPAALVMLMLGILEGSLDRTSIFVFFVVWFIAAAHILLIGIPVLFAMKKSDVLGWSSVISAGFLIGLLPNAIFTWPYSKAYSSSGNWYGGYREFVVSGVPTIYGWLAYIQANCVFGVFGVICALAFWRIWLRTASA